MHSDTSQRDAVVSRNLGLVSYCVRGMQRSETRAHTIPEEDLYQVGAGALIQVADRQVASSAIDNFSAYARKSVMVAMRRHVAEWHHGVGCLSRSPTPFEVRLDTGSQIANAQPMVVPQEGNSYWVRDAIGQPPARIRAMFTSAGYTIEGRAQMAALRRRLDKMVP